MSSPVDPVPENTSPPPAIDINSIARMSGQEFELLVAGLLKKMDFQVELTKASHDGGIDLIAHCHAPFMQGKYIIQCKHYDGTVGEPFIRDLFGVMTSERANKGVLVTNSVFSPSARAFAAGKPLELIDGCQLLHLLARYEIVNLSQVETSIASDQEVSRLRKLIEALPKELRWRVQLAQHVLGVVEFPRGILGRDQLLPYVEEAEVQLSVIYDIAQRRPSSATEFHLLEYASAIWLGNLQLHQGRADAAIKWMAELRGVRFEKATTPAEMLDDLYMANAVNLTNIAASCGKPLPRQRFFARNGERIHRLAERRKYNFTQALRSHEQEPDAVEFIISQIKRLDGINEDNDLQFLVGNLVALEAEMHGFGWREIGGLFHNVGSVSEIISPSHAIRLVDDTTSPFTQGLAMETILQPYLDWVETWEARR